MTEGDNKIPETSVTDLSADSSAGTGLEDDLELLFRTNTWVQHISNSWTANVLRGVWDSMVGPAWQSESWVKGLLSKGVEVAHQDKDLTQRS